jgi:hypothetical protein
MAKGDCYVLRLEAYGVLCSESSKAVSQQGKQLITENLSYIGKFLYGFLRKPYPYLK